MKPKKLFAFCSMFVMLVSLIGVVPASAAPPPPPVIPDSALKVMFTTVGGADVLPTTRTVAHWFGSTLDPNNGVTYGYNMVGADRNNCSGSGCAATVTADIIPVNVVVGGLTFNGTDVVNATLASPQFATNDYGSTPFATNSGFARGSGGVLSQADAGIPLQLQDATMRAQFNKTGVSTYHLMLNPVVHDPVTIVVPGNHGSLLQSGRGVVFASVEVQWWATQIQNLDTTLGYIDQTHLPIYLTNKVLLHIGLNPTNCCIIGFHGAGPGPQVMRMHTDQDMATVTSPSRRSHGPRGSHPASTLVRMVASTGRCRISTHSAMRSPNGRTTHSSTTSLSHG